MKPSPQTARRLRRNQTDAERILWFRLRDRRLNGWKFRRQFPIDRYIVDFFCADAHLIIELDGGQHAVRTDSDAQRTRILEAMGYLVLRFWNNDVMKNIDGVLEEINAALEGHSFEPPHPHPLPYGERVALASQPNASDRPDKKHRGKLTMRSSCVPSPHRGEGQDEGGRMLEIFSESSEPPDPNPLPYGEREALASQPNASDRPDKKRRGKPARRSSCVPSPRRGEGQDEGGRMLEIFSESFEPPHPNPLTFGERE